MFNRIKSLKIPPALEKYALFLMLLLWAGFRLLAYGDPTLSIAGNDTITFVEASRVPLFSVEMMTGRRLLTTNLVYKIFEPESGYQILVNGSLETSRRILQPGFDRIVILQLVLSLLGWSALAWVVALQMKNFATRVMAVLIIPAFGYTPQVADWDSILMSEAMTFSLFALQLALLIYLVFSLYRNPNAKLAPWMTAWGVVYFFWANLRDTNNYAALVLIGLTGLTLFTPKFKKHRALIGVMVFAAILFVVGLVTFQQSGRSLLSTINIYISDIFPHPARVEYMKGLGMPEPDTREFDIWFKKHGVAAVTRFIFAHPGYALDKLARDFPESFKKINQTYFHVPEMKVFRARLIAFGESLHPETSTPFLMGLLLLAGLIFAAITGKTETAQPWAWIGVYLVLAATIAIIPTILGDTWALSRHSLYSTTVYRLSMWLLAVVTVDLALQRKDTSGRTSVIEGAAS